MKHFLLSALILLPITAAANCQREAQFAGIAQDVTHFETPNGRVRSEFRIKLTSWYRPSMVCPMEAVEVENAVIRLNRYIQEGQEVSGVILYDTQLGSYRIE